MSESKSLPHLPDIAGNIYDILEPLDAPTRAKVVQGALALLGDPGGQGSVAVADARIRKCRHTPPYILLSCRGYQSPRLDA